MSSKPIIAVSPLVDYQRDSLWMLPGYFEGIEQAGGIPLMLPLTTDAEELEEILYKCRGVLLTGGQDVSPQVYGCADKDAIKLVGETSPERDIEERLLLKLALAQDLPVLGICRGIQVINAMLGGTLWQDLPAQNPSQVNHHGTAPYNKPVHSVDVLPNTPLADYLGAGELRVNSYHHQAVKTLAPKLEAMAKSEDGLVEALWHTEKRFVWGVQWHPEFAYKTDDASRQIFSALIDATYPRELIWV